MKHHDFIVIICKEKEKPEIIAGEKVRDCGTSSTGFIFESEIGITLEI